MAVPPKTHTQLDIGILPDVSIFETGFGRFRTVSLYMHFLDLTLGIWCEPVLGGLSRLKEIASHNRMQMVRSNEKNNIIYSSSMSEQMRKIIYPNSMNREDLSKLSKEQLINMLLGKQTVSANKAGPVKQTASTAVGPVFKPKSLTQLAAEKLEQSIKRPAVLPKQSNRLPTLKTLAANAMVKDKIKYFEELSDKQVPTIRLHKIPVSLQDMRDEELKRARVSKYKKQSSFQNLFHERLEQMPGKRERAQITINIVNNFSRLNIKCRMIIICLLGINR